MTHAMFIETLAVQQFLETVVTFEVVARRDLISAYVTVAFGITLRALFLSVSFTACCCAVSSIRCVSLVPSVSLFLSL